MSKQIELLNLSPEVAKQIRYGLENRMKPFGKDFHSRSHAQATLLGRFFHCHLLLEDLLLKIIKSECPRIGDIEKVAQHFNQKLNILKNMDDKPFKEMYPAFEAINRIRNKFGHNPKYLEFDLNEIQPVTQVISSYNPAGKSPIEIVETFTILAYAGFSAFQSAEELAKDAKAEMNRIEREQLERYKNILDELYGSTALT